MLKMAIPNLFTLTNLSFGVLSILETFRQNYFCAAILIVIAALIDRYDGRIARFLNISGNLGKELDSLADLVSFGVAPALLMFIKYYFSSLDYIEVIGGCFILSYIMSGAYRLAKYNISEFDGVFTGVPITVAGFIIALFSLVAPSNGRSILLSTVLIGILAYLMLSKFKLKKV
ncbi:MULTISPECIES: CDP-diacylglycerol--serine O-phosphatidyltransferase [Clostridium]|uniref:CDP-diacylglycerol--serine O-phosphatidyltransferase n=1 Tax=Clostridium ragsdalei P11 TaxID=1353534 RepID=A0A1A6B2K5_9CLOT|nr:MULTISPECIES: CDP-diacylglycerol--serine O-phosphatidyltransferase [Clostridium]OBR96564.1 phosphatidylcholine synthase [Clostridium ragsdalei P11]QXE17915.1 CDP-diacylglycerol--serine O-phosphatidyltransferase [Clostridium sp. 001]